MIDTDRYENITPERWTVDEEDPCRVIDVQECTIARTDFVDIEEERGWQLANAQLIADAPLLLEEVKRLREENHTLEMMAWEYENVWEWLMQNADYTCRKLLLLIEEWKEEDGLVTIDGMTYRKEMIE